jgi:hypothetical protein
MEAYSKFLADKQHVGEDSGFKPIWIPDALFDYQKALVEWSLMKGRGALFEDCGLGKTAQALTWAENVVRKTNKRVIIFTPLAVGAQFVEEGEKFGIECQQSKDGSLKGKIIIANYERIHYFNSKDFVGAVCDESSILKNFDGKTKEQVTEFLRKLRYRLLGTATPAPNDFIELGTSSEALGEMGYMDMLGRFFKNDQNSNHPNRIWGNAKWRFRGHAERDFWRWVCSWARAIRKPSDLGFSDDKFKLPEMILQQHVIEAKIKRDGFLFDIPANTLEEQREERRRTVDQRCTRAAELVKNHPGPSIAWCHLNDEGDLLEKLIVDSIQVSGSDSIDKKEEALEAFKSGKVKNLVSKPDICGHGLNFQHCAHQTFFPSHSFEQFYQAVRRSWRFGQKRNVTIDIVTSEGEARVMENLQRKTANSEVMFERLVASMNRELKIEKKKNSKTKIQLPSFI